MIKLTINNILPPFLNFVENFCSRLESRFGLYFTAVILSLILFILCCIYNTPSLITIEHGVGYEQLSSDPFNFSNNSRFQYRILTPLIGYLLFLRAKYYMIVPLLMGILFLASIYVYFRKDQFSAIESLGICSLVAFSTPILFILHFQGYVDTTSYLLLFLCIIFIKNPLLIVLFYGLAVLNHESNLFAIPWLILFSGASGFKSFKPYLRTALCLFVAILPMLAYRQYVSQYADVFLSFSFFLSKNNVADNVWLQYQHIWLGIFEGFKLFWIFPILAIIITINNKNHQKAAFLSMAVICSLAQLLIASDTSRLMGLAFPAIIFGAREVRNFWGNKKFVKWLWVIIGINFLIPSYCVAQDYVIPYLPLPISLLLNYFFEIDVWELAWT